MGALGHYVLEEDSEDGSRHEEEAYGGGTGEEDGTCIDHPQEALLQAAHGADHVDPVAVEEDKGMVQCLESAVDMVGALMDDVRMEEVGGDPKLLGCMDQSATAKQATTVDLEEFPFVASFAPAAMLLVSISAIGTT